MAVSRAWDVCPARYADRVKEKSVEGEMDYDDEELLDETDDGEGMDASEVESPIEEPPAARRLPVRSSPISVSEGKHHHQKGGLGGNRA